MEEGAKDAPAIVPPRGSGRPVTAGAQLPEGGTLCRTLPRARNSTLASPPVGRVYPRIELLGLPLAEITSQELVEAVSKALEAGRGGWIITANVDHLAHYRSDEAAARMYHEADFVVADGMPLLWATRLRGTPLPGRVAGADLVWSLAGAAAGSGFSLYLLGGAPGAAEKAEARFRARFPGLHIAGVSSPQVSAVPTGDELEAIRTELERTRPDLVYVALGAPKQERLIQHLRPLFPGIWWVGVGVSLSFVAGEIKRAPVWMQRVGLEWFHRLLQEPRRLASRYLARNLPFAARLLVQSWREGR
jgi:N-acetylglucosaminyldiphosphoundecaprenol N-acetyl-beta-D-mannosaminyltransferase